MGGPAERLAGEAVAVHAGTVLTIPNPALIEINGAKASIPAAWMKALEGAYPRLRRIIVAPPSPGPSGCA